MRCLWIGELRCEPGTMRVAPFTDVKSSSSQMVLHTQKPDSSATGLASQCSGWHFRDQGSLDRAFRLLNLKIFAENMADGTRHRGIGNHTLEDLALVHQVGQASGPWFLAELRTRVIAFLCPKLLDACTDLMEEAAIHHPGQNRPPQFVQPL
jgi:hypothetical protein